jgi:tRNA threonylcarbamoyl adenosine modification protein YeaZ
MRTLAVDFSSERRSVAVLNGMQVTGQAAELGGRATHPFALIETALREANWEREAVECLAVGLGPGSYAGIRSAIALAQGWQVARGIRLLGISSVEALAAQAQAAGMLGSVHFLIDAQRGEFYTASYEILDGVTLRSVLDLRVASAGEVQNTTQRGRLVVSQDLSSRFPGAVVMQPDAAALGRLAQHRTDYVSGDRLQPIYLRETSFVKAPPPRVT